MAFLWQFNALVRKNLITMKRNCCQTFAEILFPILLMVLIVGVRKGFSIKKYYFDKKEGTVDEYIQVKSVSNIDYTTLLSLSASITAPSPSLPPDFTSFSPKWN